MKTLRKLLFFTLLSVFFIASCDDHKVEEPKLDKVVVKDNVLSSKIVSDLFFDVNKSTSESKSAIEEECFSVKRELSEDEKKLTIKLTYTNCMVDGIVKNGEVKVDVFSDWEKGADAKLTFVGFTVDGNSIDGTMNIKFDEIGKFVANSDLKLNYSDGSFTSWKGEQVIKVLSDGTWEVSGETSGQARNGKSFFRKEAKLIINSECAWYTGGNMTLVFDEDETYEIEFGAKCGEVNYTYKGIKATLQLD